MWFLGVVVVRQWAIYTAGGHLDGSLYACRPRPSRIAAHTQGMPQGARASTTTPWLHWQLPSSRSPSTHPPTRPPQLPDHVEPHASGCQRGSVCPQPSYQVELNAELNADLSDPEQALASPRALRALGEVR